MTMPPVMKIIIREMRRVLIMVMVVATVRMVIILTILMIIPVVEMKNPFPTPRNTRLSTSV